jgi:hypothetical protein
MMPHLPAKCIEYLQHYLDTDFMRLEASKRAMISLSTACTYMSMARETFGVSSSSAATLRAMECGLIKRRQASNAS